MGTFWHAYLYEPLLNVLIFLYDTVAFGNLGVAVIELTVLLRIVLLPFTVIEELNRSKFSKISQRIESIRRDYKGDTVKQKERIRELLRENKVGYWSKVILIGVQLLVLVLLYQVFIGGIDFSAHNQLYSWVRSPGSVDSTFLGFELGARSEAFWPGVVAVYLFIETYLFQRERRNLVTKSDITYLLLFPVFTFFALYLLPIVKSIFVLTSMTFSLLVFGLRQLYSRWRERGAEIE